ncbi:MAG: hypothetical protein LQ352_006766 [Teloschistes flavicans]|nr:MAG: hypothetical protein LQ352_006766 [Teloschistes flavicans]
MAETPSRPTTTEPTTPLMASDNGTTSPPTETEEVIDAPDEEEDADLDDGLDPCMATLSLPIPSPPRLHRIRSKTRNLPSTNLYNSPRRRPDPPQPIPPPPHQPSRLLPRLLLQTHLQHRFPPSPLHRHLLAIRRPTAPHPHRAFLQTRLHRQTTPPARFQAR